MSSTVRFSRAPSATKRRPGSGRMTEDASAALADKALAAFVIIHAMLKRSRRLQTFCDRPDINARFPGYAVCVNTWPKTLASSCCSPHETVQTHRLQLSAA